jgi:hypothetical protein
MQTKFAERSRTEVDHEWDKAKVNDSLDDLCSLEDKLLCLVVHGEEVGGGGGGTVQSVCERVKVRGRWKKEK